MLIYVIVQHVVKLGFQKKTDYQDGQKIKEKATGKRYQRL